MTLREPLEAALAGGEAVAAARVALAAAGPAEVDAALRDFAAGHAAAALPVLTELAAEGTPREVRRAARRALYRLAQRGISAPAPARPAPRPVVEREPERATRAWTSGVDGTGSRALWVLLQGGYGGFALCSLILNDVAGILEVAGGDITRKRLEGELARLRASQKLPWVEIAPARAVALVNEALGLHAALGTTPPAAFGRWQRSLGEAGAAAGETSGSEGGIAPPDVDAADLERSVELLDLPEFAGWFLDPEAVQSDGVELLQARESRLVVSDQIRAEREAAIVDAVLEREMTREARRRWARRLEEMAAILRATDRPEPARLAEAAAAALRDEAREARRHPLAVLLARRGLEAAAEVALGRVRLADVSRKPGAGAA